MSFTVYITIKFISETNLIWNLFTNNNKWNILFSKISSIHIEIYTNKSQQKSVENLRDISLYTSSIWMYIKLVDSHRGLYTSSFEVFNSYLWCYSELYSHIGQAENMPRMQPRTFRRSVLLIVYTALINNSCNI